MAKSTLGILSIIIGAALLFNPCRILGAEEPEIQIVLEFKNKVYTYGEPIGAKVQVIHHSGKNLLLSRGFRALDFFVEMRIIDPAKRLVLVRHHKTHNEFPDAPPLPFILYNKEPARVIQCEALPAKTRWEVTNEDIRNHYALDLPGEYSAQIQISAATFEGEPCNTKNYRWLGVLTSNTENFYIEPEDKKKQTAELPTPLRKFTQEEKIAAVIESRQLSAETKKNKANASQNSQPANTNRALEPFVWFQHQIATPWINNLYSDLSANLVAYNQPWPEFLDSNLNTHFASAESVPLIASKNETFTIKLAAGGGKKIPTADITVPAQTLDVPVDTAIQVDLSGVSNNTVVIMNVLGQEVYKTSSPDPGTAYPHTQRIDDPNDNSKFALIYKDPQTDFFNCQQVDVLLKAYNENKPNKIYKPEFSFKTICQIANDNDGDGIPNDVENLLGTNPEIKTLFVRPKKIQDFQFVYWNGFVALFPATTAGFADIPAFTHAGIEISVIGNPGNPYALMRDFYYDPAQDSNHPPCDILEIIYMPYDAYCAYGHHNYGHTYFYTLGSTWYWDTKGYVPNDQTSVHYQEYHYFTPLIYPFPLANYLSEGAYPRIENTQRPVPASGCGLNQCYNFNYSSPLNLNASYPVTGRPDGTVEFNDIVFSSGTKEIVHVGSQGNEKYNHDAVLRRTIVHEMGHALLAASENDHCNDFQCIMFDSVEDWEPWEFGPPSASGRSCTHSPKPNGSSEYFIKDIRAPGVIHNSVH